MLSKFRSWLHRPEKHAGQGTTEYGVILVGVVAAVAVAASVFAPQVEGLWSKATNSMNVALPGNSQPADPGTPEVPEEQGLSDLYFADVVGLGNFWGDSVAPDEALKAYVNDKILSLKPGESFTLPDGMYLTADAGMREYSWPGNGYTVTYEDVQAAHGYLSDNDWGHIANGQGQFPLEVGINDDATNPRETYQAIYEYDQANGNKYGLQYQEAWESL